MKLVVVVLWLFSASLVYAGSDFDKVNRLGTKYCAKARTYLTDPSLPQTVQDSLKKEYLVIQSLCKDDGTFLGKANIDYPSTIPVNIAAIMNSWKEIAGKFRANAGAVVWNYFSEAKAVLDSVTPYTYTDTNEYSIELKKNGIVDEKAIQKSFSLDLSKGEQSNQTIRKN